MINITSVINAATLNNPSKIRPMIIWSILEFFLRGTPYAILILTIWELFIPLQYPGTPINTTKLWIFCAALLIITFFIFIASKNAYFSAYKESYKLCAEGRIKLVEHLHKLPMGFFIQNDPGKLGERIIGDYANTEMLLSHLLPQLFGSLAMPIALLLGLATIDLKLTLIAAAPIPLSIPVAIISNKLIAYMGDKHQVAKVKTSSVFLEYIQAIKLIKAFNLEEKSFKRLNNAFKTLRNESIRLEAGAGPTIIVASLILFASYPLIVLTGLTFFIQGTLPLTFYIVFIVITAHLYTPLTQVLTFSAMIQYMGQAALRTEKLLNTPRQSEGTIDTIESYNIEFKNVSFAYLETPVIQNFSAKMPQNSLTALIGPSGCGKTTIAKLIARFWDPQEGEILIGGKNIKEYTNNALTNAISIVFQDTYLFNDTVLNNLKIAKPNATFEEITNATKAAQCHDFILSLPQGYDTIIAEAGSTISGGEKQRLAIARALLKNAPIILLDEVTASLDPENELKIQQALSKLTHNKTVVTIAHRLNTIQNAEQIIAIKNGNILETGTHQQLIENNGLYAQLFEKQQKTKGWMIK